MKNIFKILVLFTLLLLVGCESYTEQTRLELQMMPQPVVLKGKSKMTFWYSITVLDGKGNLHQFGNSSRLARSIGEIYQINDTIKIPK